MRKKVFVLENKNLTLEKLMELSLAPLASISIQIAPKALDKAHKSYKFVQNIVQKNQTVYGINTGFGILSDTKILPKDLTQLQENLLRSHACGVGEFISKDMSRAMLILRSYCLLKGHSGVNPKIIQRLVDFYNLGITPLVPSQGSVGASGDLAPLAHLSLPLLGEGLVEFQGKKVKAISALKKCNLSKIVLGPKDGLALINGTTWMLTQASFALHSSQKLIQLADIACALSLDSIKGSVKAFDEKIHQLKPHPGQIKTAANIKKLLKNSPLNQSHTDCGKIQDPYSFRCVPQVHGAIRGILEHVKSVVDVEIQSVTDNPLIFPQQNEVISGGNFHGQALSFAMDYLSMGLSEICNISERRVEKLINPHFSDLPAFLIKDSGLNSGLMIAQVTAAALTSENKTLCFPASVDSIPTSNDKEDHVSMGPNAGKKLHMILENAYHCLSIEFLCNTQALYLQRPLKSSPVLEDVYQLIRTYVKPIVRDRDFSKDMRQIVKLIKDNQIINTVYKKLGSL